MRAPAISAAVTRIAFLLRPLELTTTLLPQIPSLPLTGVAKLRGDTFLLANGKCIWRFIASSQKLERLFIRIPMLVLLSRAFGDPYPHSTIWLRRLAVTTYLALRTL